MRNLGSFGTFANIDPRIEKYVANKLKLKIANIYSDYTRIGMLNFFIIRIIIVR